jgi:hypothetical protein
MQQALDMLVEPHPHIRTSFTDAIKYREKINQAIAALEQELAKPEQVIVPFPSFMRKRVEQALKDAIHPTGMSVHDGKVKVLVSDLSRMLLVIDSAPTKPEQEPTLFFGRAVYFADPRTGEILPPHDLSIEANRVAYDVAMHYANKTKEKLSKPEQDWSLLQATQESLREHQARIKELEARRQWVGLTDDEIFKDDEIMVANSGYGANFETLRELTKTIESAVRRKNT